MSRLPFDPSKTEAARRAGDPTARAPISVTQLAGFIDAALRTGVPGRLRVVGEISGFRDRTHWYFDLKDSGAVVSCVMFASAARSVGFTPRDGQQAVCSGRVEFFAKHGKTQFYVDRVEPVGEGAREAAFLALCEKLRALGWFDVERKRPLPRFARNIAVITSRTGAALQDVLDTVTRRCPAVGVVVVDSRVQGDGAAAEVVAALCLVAERSEALGIDAVLITRGGGSVEDLWSFNDESLAEAIVRFPLPVVAAIGHETDTTIAELVADARCATPTQAAMRLTPDSAALHDQLDALARRLGGDLGRRVQIERERLRAAWRHPFFADPRSVVLRGRREASSVEAALRAAARQRLHEASRRLGVVSVRLEKFRPERVYAARRTTVECLNAALQQAVRARVAAVDTRRLLRRLGAAWSHAQERRRASLGSAGRALELVGPMAVLGRGYSVTLDARGAVVRSAAAANPGQLVTTKLADGSFGSIVTGDGHRAGAPVPLAAPRSRRARSRPEPPDQMDLFGDGR